jgi:hypothetical protein
VQEAGGQTALNHQAVQFASASGECFVEVERIVIAGEIGVQGHMTSGESQTTDSRLPDR